MDRTVEQTAVKTVKLDVKLAKLMAANPHLSMAEAGRLFAVRALKKHINNQKKTQQLRQAKRRLKGKAAKPKVKLVSGGAVSPR